MLVDAGAYVENEMRDKKYGTLLFLLLMDTLKLKTKLEDKVEIACYLLSKVNHKMSYMSQSVLTEYGGVMPLHLLLTEAMYQGRLDLIKILVAAGARVEDMREGSWLTNKNGSEIIQSPTGPVRIPLCNHLFKQLIGSSECPFSERVEIADYLLSQVKDPLAFINSGDESLIASTIITQDNKIQMLQVMMKYGFDVETIKMHTQSMATSISILRYCVKEGWERIVEFLLENPRIMKMEKKIRAETALITACDQQDITIPMHLIGLYLNQKHVTKPLDKHEKIERIAVIGAGLMGSGIASVSALAGLKVTVIDTSMEKSQQAMDYLNKLLNSELKRKRKTKSEAEAIRDNLTCSDQLSAIKGCQVVIEAVFESIEVKSKLFKEIEPWLESNTVIASNTSSIPISEMANSVKDQGRFVGMHFFSPVEKMALVEIIQGEKTTTGTIEMIKTLTLMIKKTPIVVNDGCGFYTTRVFARYPQEAIICLEEGIHPAMIEQSGRQAGMPMGPLEISDAVGLDVMAHIMTVAKQYKVYSDDTNCEGVINELLKQQRMGKKNKQGFYDYSSGAASLWKGSYGWVKDGKQIDLKSLSERLLYGQLVEAMKCWHESILDDKQSGDLGAVLGWGFAPYTGGPLSLIGQIGWDVFIEKSKDMANRYGKRFQLPEGMKKPNFIK